VVANWADGALEQKLGVTSSSVSADIAVRIRAAFISTQTNAIQTMKNMMEAAGELSWPSRIYNLLIRQSEETAKRPIEFFYCGIGAKNGARGKRIGSIIECEVEREEVVPLLARSSAKSFLALRRSSGK
jgi:hypothetical protein